VIDCIWSHPDKNSIYMRMCELATIVINKYQYVPVVHRDGRMIRESGSRERPKRTTSAWCLWINYLILSHMNNSGFGMRFDGRNLYERQRPGKWNCLLIYRQYSKICTFSIFRKKFMQSWIFWSFFFVFAMRVNDEYDTYDHSTNVLIIIIDINYYIINYYYTYIFY